MATESAPAKTMRRDYLPPAFLAPTVDIVCRLSADGKAVTVGARTKFHVNLEHLTAIGAEASTVPDLALDADLKNISVSTVRINGEDVAAESITRDTDKSKLTISGAAISAMAPEAAEGGDFVLETVNLQNPIENKALEGLYMSEGDYTTQMEAEGFRRFIPHLDRPDVLSLYSTTMEGPKEACPELLSNGDRVAGGDGPIPSDHLVAGLEVAEGASGLHWVRWEHAVPKPCYLFAVVAGQLSSIEDVFTTRSGKDVKLRFLAKEADVEKCRWAMASLKRAMAWDELRYGREYDCGIFHVVATAAFSMGAMENSTLNVFNTKYVLADEASSTDTDFDNVLGVIGHEYFHNWSGNRVTCRDWFQLSLKEGFTVFRDQEFSADMASRPIKRIGDVAILRAYQFAQAAGPMSHPVRPASFSTINNFYSVTVYNGGAEVVRMYPTLLGRGAFRRGTDLYFSRHDGEAVTCDHFCSAMEDASWDALPEPDASAERADVDPAKGDEEWVDPPYTRCGDRPLTQFRRWYSVAGTPSVDAALAFDRDARTVTVTLKQAVPPTEGQSGPKPPLHIPVALGLLGPDGDDLPFTLRPDPASWDQRFGASMRPAADGDPEADRDAEMFPGRTAVLHLTEPEQTFVLEGVDYPEPAPGATTAAGLPVPPAPTPSVLRGFSAPVRLALAGDDAPSRLFRLAHDADPFCRFEASNLLATALITGLVPSARPSDAAATTSGPDAAPVLNAPDGPATSAFCSAVGHMLASATARAAGTDPAGVDPALVAHILALPPYKALVQECANRDAGVADPRAVVEARSALRRALATAIAPQLVAAYKACTAALDEAASASASASAAAGESVLMSPENKARRALRNACLGLLIGPVARAASEAAEDAADEAAAAGEAAEAAAAAAAAAAGFDAIAAARDQMGSAGNMTDEYGAFSALLRLPAAHPARAAAVAAFYGKWEGNSLVEDKWMSAQAFTGSASDVLALMKHRAFDLLIPNKVYSLVRAFAEGNPKAFHDASGSGYDVLADVVAELDGHNPQVAARIAGSFTAGRSLPPLLAAAMKARVDRLMAKEGASRDLKEVMERCQVALVAALGE